MTEEQQQQITAEATAQQAGQQAAEPAQAAAAKARKKRAAGKKSGKPKLQKFDVMLMQLLKEGRSSAEEIKGIFNVDEGEFRKRLATLLKRKLIVADDALATLHLSIQGVNGYKPDWKRQADKWLERKNEVTEEPRERKEDGKPVEAEEMKQAKLDVEVVKKPVAEEQAPVERMDLEEVIRKYGPNESQRRWKERPSPFIERHVKNNDKMRETSQGKPRAEAASDATENPVKVVKQGNSRHSAESDEKCELCKSGFIISVKAGENNPKYGHCFCGAAYHKDCFEAVLEGDKKCVRCGRKLALTLDVKAEEAVSGITDISA